MTYDYFGRLNDAAGLGKGLWLHRNGSSEKPLDSVVGSAGASVQSLAFIVDRAMTELEQLKAEITNLSKVKKGLQDAIATTVERAEKEESKA